MPNTKFKSEIERRYSQLMTQLPPSYSLRYGLYLPSHCYTDVLILKKGLTRRKAKDINNIETCRNIALRAIPDC